DAGEDGRLDIETLGEPGIVGPLASMQQLRPFGLGGFDVAQHAVVLGPRDNGAHGGRGIGGDARLEVTDARLDALKYRSMDRAVDEGAAGRAARLPAPREVHAGDGGRSTGTG